MSIATYSKFQQYKSMIHSSPTLPSEEFLKSEEFLVERDEKKGLDIYYAPFEHVNEKAKVVIVGITPGLFQMMKSYQTVYNAKDSGLSDEEILQQVKNNSSFEGTMRKNLVSMLDQLNLHTYLNLSSTLELFSTANHLVHTTSVIAYPVFYKGKNYSGSTPSIVKTPLLNHYVRNCFVSELNSLEPSLIIPLGVNVGNAINQLVDRQVLDKHTLLSGFPHPSGGNGHRVKQFEAHKEKMRSDLQQHFSSLVTL
ncbi:hypothetical protein M1K46_03400 [Fictibacillus sp. WQ 8-8]|uniref:hypothetical protein n=1 Tax=Fictibacillus sp. WQ 8-8 TaxID=2938788 RepID=UPI0021090379|nr:hypothetical protein [Fictibacillus sp. WQ 8-8]MCQ6264712.1 hypothetical protein [Fictibacillus sp. WQ 8-8]